RRSSYVNSIQLIFPRCRDRTFDAQHLARGVWRRCDQLYRRRTPRCREIRRWECNAFSHEPAGQHFILPQIVSAVRTSIIPSFPARIRISSESQYSGSTQHNMIRQTFKILSAAMIICVATLLAMGQADGLRGSTTKSDRVDFGAGGTVVIQGAPHGSVKVVRSRNNEISISAVVE